MATPTEQNTQQIRELEKAVVSLQEQLKYAVGELGRMQSDVREATKLQTETQKEVADLRTGNALLRQQLDEFRKWIDKWDTRLWAVVAGVLLFLLSSVVTLVVAVTRK